MFINIVDLLNTIYLPLAIYTCIKVLKFMKEIQSVLVFGVCKDQQEKRGVDKSL